MNGIDEMATKNQPPPPRQSEGNEPLMLAILVGVVALCGYMLWSKFHAAIAAIYGYWRMLTNAAGWLVGEYVQNVPYLVKPFHDAAEYFRVVQFKDVQWDTIIATSIPVNIGLFVLVLIPLASRSIRASLKTNPLNHKNFGKTKDFTVESFMKAQESVYPHLKLYSALNLLKQPIIEGRLRMGDTEKQFVMGHGLVSRESRIDHILIDRVASEKVFASQMGAYWRGLEALKPHELVLFAVFAPKAAAIDPQMSDSDYEASIAESAALMKSLWQEVFCPDAEGNVPSGPGFLTKLEGSDVYRRAQKTALRYASSQVVSDITQQHAYVRTVLFELMRAAGRTGVLPSADVRWCKLVDRSLWFTLNTVGRSVSITEVAGIYAHYLYEHKAKRAVERPMVETAVEALQEAFARMVFTEKEWATIQGEWTAQDRAPDAAQQELAAQQQAAAQQPPAAATAEDEAKTSSAATPNTAEESVK